MVYALIDVYDDEKLNALVNVYLDYFKNFLYRLGENPENNEKGRNDIIAQASHVVRYISEKIMRGKRVASNKDLEDLY